jgi:hypothetical protein
MSMAAAAPSPLAALGVAGVYVNLDRSTERRAHVEAELARHGLASDYVRFSALGPGEAESRGSPLEPGEIGCFRSHCAVLRQYDSGERHLHVAEDDIVFSSRFAAVTAELVRSGMLDRYDIIFLDTVVAVGLELVSEFRRLQELNLSRARRGEPTPVIVLDFHHHRFAGTSSYLVGRGAIARVARLLERALAAGPTLPLDLQYARFIATDALRVGCAFPFATTVRLDSATGTTIAGREGGEAIRFACDLLRYAFHADCDWEVAREAIERIAPSLLTETTDRIVGAAFAQATRAIPRR